MKLLGKCFSAGGEIPASVKQENVQNHAATLVSVSGSCTEPLDPDTGAAVAFSFEEEPAEYMADWRSGEYWCSPFFGHNLAELPDETQLLLVRFRDGSYCAVLPLVSDDYKCVLRGSENGAEARLFTWNSSIREINAPAFVYAFGSDPFRLVHDCAQAGLQVLGDRCLIREKRTYPERLEYLGWCTWDAMHIEVSEEGVLEKCREFHEKNIPVKWMMLDDMWAEIHAFYNGTYTDFRSMLRLMYTGKMYECDGDPKRFPSGLKGLIEKVSAFGIETGIWHPTTAYWAGVDPDGPLFRRVKDDLILRNWNNGDMWVPDWQEDHSYDFYSTLHRHFKESGATFVKVDNQSMCRRFYRDIATVGKAARSYHKGLERSVNENFDGCMINCMGLASEDMWNRPNSPVTRCSGDFMPENRAWFTKHILQCAYNSVLQGQFLFCDWDMWWTDDEQSGKNSVLQAVSGGPVYVSDQIGRSRAEVLRPMLFSDGRILRCDRPAMPTADCLTHQPDMLKVQNTCCGGGAIAAFNLREDDAPVTGEVSPAQVYGLQGERFLAREYFSGEWQLLGRNDTLPVRLENRDDYKLYLFVPVQGSLAVLGRKDKYIAPVAVTEITQKENTVSLSMYEAGELTFWAEKEPSVTVQGEAATVKKEDGLYTVSVPTGAIVAITL